ncbi:MAG: DHHW family protein, partial [Eubacteriales bacterium]|nr:DHHW family protein [Eubacteriales bacterium]
EYLMYNSGKEKKADIIDMKYANEITDKYLAFMSSGGANWSVVKTDVHNGEKVMVIKDSFGNAFVPFLLPHYEEIYIVDPRFYNVSTTGNIVDFVKENGINEVVFCIYMEDVNWHKFMSSVEHLLGE